MSCLSTCIDVHTTGRVAASATATHSPPLTASLSPNATFPPQWVVIHNLIHIAVRVYRKGFLGDKLG